MIVSKTKYYCAFLDFGVTIVDGRLCQNGYCNSLVKIIHIYIKIVHIKTVYPKDIIVAGADSLNSPCWEKKMDLRAMGHRNQECNS